MRHSILPLIISCTRPWNFQNGVKTTSLADATYGNQKNSANQPFHAWKIWWRNCVTRYATSVVRLFYTKSNLCLFKKLNYDTIFSSFWAIPLLFERLFFISFENNRDCHITMPLSLETMEVQIKGDQWNKRFRTVQVYCSFSEFH